MKRFQSAARSWRSTPTPSFPCSPQRAITGIVSTKSIGIRSWWKRRKKEPQYSPLPRWPAALGRDRRRTDRVMVGTGPAPQTRWDLDQAIRMKGRIGLTCLAVGRKWVAVGSRAGRAYLLRAGDGQKVEELIAGAAIQSIALSADESLAVCGRLDGRLALFRPPSDRLVSEIPAHLDAVSAVAFSPDGTLVASASLDRTVGLWRVEGSSLTELFHIPSPTGRPILSVKFDSGGKRLGMLVQNERAVRLWNLRELHVRLKSLGLNWE